MGGFTREELAQQAGVPVHYVDRLVELRILSPGEGNSPFSGGTPRRARFVHGLEQGGVPLGTEMEAGGGTPTEAQAAELHGLETRLRTLSRIDIVLLTLAVLAMATARYL